MVTGTAECKDCTHFEVCAYAYHQLPICDSYAEKERHGRWILQANNERTNYRWNVTAECSECCDEEKEIWAGFFLMFQTGLQETWLLKAQSLSN